MKKSTKVLLSIILVLALGAAGIFGYFYFTKDKPDDAQNSDKPADSEMVKFDVDDNVASVDGVSVIVDETGVRVFNEADGMQKTVFDRSANLSMFDGETAYFTEIEVEDDSITLNKNGEEVSVDDFGPWHKSKVYSYSVKSDKVEELFTSNYEYIEFVAVNDGNIYYADCDSENIGNLDVSNSALSLYKYNVESKESTKLLDAFAWNERVGDKVYYQADLAKKGINYHELYCFDLSTETSKLITDENAHVIKIEDNAIYYLTCEYATVEGVVVGKDHALKKTDLISCATQTLTELDFYEAGEYELWADCVGDEVYLKYASTAALFDFDDYSYNLKTNQVTKLDENDIGDYWFAHKFDSFTVIENILDDNDDGSDSVTELYLVDAQGKYTKIYESPELYYFKLTENGLYKSKPFTDDASVFEIEFIPLNVK